MNVISETFSREWAKFDYTRDRTWSQTPDERFANFLTHTNLDIATLASLRVLDAGCGNGVLSEMVARHALEVVAADISESVYAAAQSFAAIDNLAFLRCDVAARSAFPAGSFDVVYSSGVLHHTPDPRAGVEHSVEAVKPGGRIYIWLYWHVPGRRMAVRYAARRLVRRLPLRAKIAVSYPFAAVAMVTQRQRRRTWRERLVIEIDFFTPAYRSEHTPEELAGWMRDAGLVEIEITDRCRDGFGVLGFKPQPAALS